MHDASVMEAPSMECLIFRCCGALLGCETRQVSKIIEIPPIVPLPRNSCVVTGVFNYRGQILGAIDIRPLMGGTNSFVPSFQWVLLLKGKQFITGLLIEEIMGIEAVQETDLINSHGESPVFLPKTFMTDDRSAYLLDVNSLLTDPSLSVSQ